MNISHVSLALSLFTLVLLAGSFFWHRHWYRYSYLAQNWYDIKKILLDNPRFANPDNTTNYQTVFSAEEQLKYDTFAELCWGFAEDLWINGQAKQGYYVPTLKKFKRLHYSWLRENEEAYDAGMVKFIRELES